MTDDHAERRVGRVVPIGRILRAAMPEGGVPTDGETYEDVGARVARLIQDRPEPTEDELAAARQRDWERAAEKLGIWRRFWPANLAEAHETAAIMAVRRYLAEGFPCGRALILSGPPSVGKTWALVGLLRALDRQARRFAYFPALCNALISPDSDEAMRRASTVQVLALDDLGAEYVKPGGALESKIDALITERHGNVLPTLITTNLSVDDFRVKVSERIVERLSEWAFFETVTGENLRRTPPSNDADPQA